MKGASCIACVAAVSASSQFPSWQEYKDLYGLAFNGKEDSARERVYNANLQFIAAKNSEQSSYTLGVNKFTFLSEAEFIAAFTGEGQEDPETIKFSRGVHDTALADSVDWSTDSSVMNPVKDQGHCGSCWAFAATGTTESSYAIDFGTLFNLSEQQLVDCQEEGLDHPGEGGCEGGLSRYTWIAGGIYDKHGACPSAEYPYTATYNTCTQSSCTPVIPPGFVIGFVQADANAGALRTALVERPMKVSVYADSIWSAYTGGIAVASTCYSGTNHAVIAVGFDGEDSFKIRNSWGPNWGEGGYIRISPASDCSTGPFSIWYRTPVYPQWSSKASITV